MLTTNPTSPSSSSVIIFRQLFDTESSTYTYILGDPNTHSALIIDPVLEQVERDATYVKELGLDLKFAINTHIHADHISGTGRLKQKHFPGVQTVLGATGNENAKADLKVNKGDTLRLDAIQLEFRSTPGHTHGDHTLVFHEKRMAFTGDTVLIRGCGRTDFQQGSSRALFDSVWSQVFTLPDDYFLYPAHDYKGRTVTTVGEEKQFNPRLTKGMDVFVEIMKNLKLDYPKKINEAVPVNMVCGLHELLTKEDMDRLKKLEVGGEKPALESKPGDTAIPSINKESPSPKQSGCGCAKQDCSICGATAGSGMAPQEGIKVKQS